MLLLVSTLVKAQHSIKMKTHYTLLYPPTTTKYCGYEKVCTHI